jgi:hypothetical protein
LGTITYGRVNYFSEDCFALNAFSARGGACGGDRGDAGVGLSAGEHWQGHTGRSKRDARKGGEQQANSELEFHEWRWLFASLVICSSFAGEAAAAAAEKN